MTELLPFVTAAIASLVTWAVTRNPRLPRRATKQQRLQRLDRAQQQFSAWYKTEAAKTRDMP